MRDAEARLEDKALETARKSDELFSLRRLLDTAEQVRTQAFRP